MSFIAGRYLVSWDTASINQLANGVTLEHTQRKRLITGDAHAETPQDGIHRGHECFAEFVMLEYNAAGAQGAFWPYAGAFGANGTVGETDVGSGRAKVLLLNQVGLSTTPASGIPASVTITRAILAEGFPVRLLFAPDLREVAIRMRIYPSAAGDFWTVA